MARKTAKLYIIDDHTVVREGLTRVFNAEPDLVVCGSSAGGKDALRGIERAKPDVVIMDLSLKGMSGLELTSELRRRSPELPILVLSMHEESEYAERALRAGAAGYIGKDATAAKVADSVRRVLSGKGAAAWAPRAKSSEETEALSARELEVFRLLGHGVSTRRIAERLGRSVKTIETHREAIKRKLGLEDAVQLVQRAAAWAARRGDLP